MKRFLYIAFLLLCCTGCQTDFEEPELPVVSMEPTMTIAELQARYVSGTVSLTEEALIGGVITASDRSGNFYRSFIIEDFTGAVEILAGTYDLHTLYPEGRVVYVSLNGLALGKSEGMYRLGLLSSGSYSLGYLDHPLLLDRHVFRSGMNEEFRPAIVSVPELTDDWIGRLVTVYGLWPDIGGAGTWATPAKDSYTGYPIEKDVRAVDVQGNAIYIYTSGYAGFAGETVPPGPIAVTGIILKNGDRYRIKMRDLRDVEAQ